jgi:hypothetical protein
MNSNMPKIYAKNGKPMKIATIIRALILAALTASAFAQVPVTPVINPHMTFNDTTGLACAGCSLYSYAAGSTTPQATYTDSTGATQNTNPVILGTDGGPLTPSGTSGAIWLGQNAYKLVLIDAGGSTVFTVDNVTGGGLFPCGPAGAIQIANSAVTGLTCDATITINPSAHSINVGTLPTAHVSIGALGTPTAWNFDTTTPATAASSLGLSASGTGTINQLAYYPAAGNSTSGTSVIPAGITATTQTPGDNSTKPATTAYVALPGAINPTGVKITTGVSMTGNQGNGTAVQHSTGPTVSGDCTKFDENGNTIDAGITCTIAVTQSANLAGSRTSGTAYPNTTTLPMFVSGNMTTAGSSIGSIVCQDGTTSLPTLVLYSQEYTATVSGGAAAFSCLIPPSYYYEIIVSGAVGGTPSNWYETTF